MFYNFQVCNWIMNTVACSLLLSLPTEICRRGLSQSINKHPTRWWAHRKGGMKSWRNIRWIECNHPYLEVLETVKVVSSFFGNKEKGPFIVKHVQRLFYFASKREQLQSTALWGNSQFYLQNTTPLQISFRTFYSNSLLLERWIQYN